MLRSTGRCHQGGVLLTPVTPGRGQGHRPGVFLGSHQHTISASEACLRAQTGFEGSATTGPTRSTPVRGTLLLHLLGLHRHHHPWAHLPPRIAWLFHWVAMETEGSWFADRLAVHLPSHSAWTMKSLIFNVFMATNQRNGRLCSGSSR